MVWIVELLAQEKRKVQPLLKFQEATLGPGLGSNPLAFKAHPPNKNQRRTLSKGYPGRLLA